jgi:hypothetical protein
VHFQKLGVFTFRALNWEEIQRKLEEACPIFDGTYESSVS